jgi:hypothetical protein
MPIKTHHTELKSKRFDKMYFRSTIPKFYHRVPIITRRNKDHMKVYCFFHILLVLLCIILYMVVRFVCYCLILYIMYCYVEIKCQLVATDEFLLQILVLAQHVSGTIMPIIRNSRVLYKWFLPVVFGAWFSSCRYSVS